MRKAFTLLELLVAMGIMLVLAALTAWLAPRMQQDYRRTRAADLLVTRLVQARCRTVRDHLATGLLPSADGLSFSQVQRPDPLCGGNLLSPWATDLSGNIIPAPRPAPSAVPWQGAWLVGGACNGCVGHSPGLGSVVTFANVDFTGLVGVGDYLSLHGGPARRIRGWQATALALDDVLPDEDFPPTCDYRIERGPRLLPGEVDDSFPTDQALDYGRCRGLRYGENGSLLPVLFGPRGDLEAGQGRVIFWLRDLGQPEGDPGSSTLVVVNPAGQVSSQPVAAGADPYANAYDGRDGGL
jgi:prepilin-type N-terminal cleavage/methylation domain-containing protein